MNHGVYNFQIRILVFILLGILVWEVRYIYKYAGFILI